MPGRRLGPKAFGPATHRGPPHKTRSLLAPQQTVSATASAVTFGTLTTAATPTVRTTFASASAVTLGMITVHAAPTVRTTFASASAVTFGKVTVTATSTRTTFASVSAVAIGKVTVTTTPTVDTVFGIASMPAGKVTLSATSVRTTFASAAAVSAGAVTVTATGTGMTPKTDTGTAAIPLSGVGVIATGNDVPPAPAGHFGGGARFPVFTAYHPPAQKAKATKVAAPSTVSGKASIGGAGVTVTARGVRTVAGTADARSEFAMSAQGTRHTFGKALTRAYGPWITIGGTRTVTGAATLRSEVSLVAVGTRTTMALSEILARTVLVASAGEMTGHTWTLDERNRQAVLYLIDPALTAMAYRKRT